MTSLTQQKMGEVLSCLLQTDQWRKSPDFCCLLRLCWHKSSLLLSGQSTSETWPTPLSQIKWRERMWWWLLMERKGFMTSTHHLGRKSSGEKWRFAYSFWFSIRRRLIHSCCYFVPTKDSSVSKLRTADGEDFDFPCGVTSCVHIQMYHKFELNFEKKGYRKCEWMLISIHYRYAIVRSWFIEISSRWR